MENQSIKKVTPATNEEVVIESEANETDSVNETITSEEEFVSNLDKTKELLKVYEERERALTDSLEKLEKEMQRTQYVSLFAREKLDEFQGLFDITDPSEQVAFIKDAVNQILIKHSYQPKDVAQQEQYQKALQEKDVEGAIGFKLSNFFKKK